MREMRKTSVSSHSLGTFLSPATVNGGGGGGGGGGGQKGWCSERVPHPSSGKNSRRHIGSASALSTPFYSGRSFPSKWEDAERWICSPVSGYSTSVCKNYASSSSHSQVGGGGGGGAQRRPKSKSGPIVPPGIAYYSNCSPAMQVLEDGTVKSLMAPSPFSTGVLVADKVSLCYGGGGGGGGGGYGRVGYCGGGDACVGRSVSVPEWSDLVSEVSLPSSQDEKVDGIKDAETAVSLVVSRRDMATQMSPDSGSTHESPRGGRSLTFPSPPSSLSIVESHHDHSSRHEIREVQVDKRATMITRSKKYGSRIIKRGLPNIEDFYRNTACASSASSWDISEATTSISKMQREEAKITAWENLQKAKAEAAIRKLEMKLEKKKSASMDKIVNQLKDAQTKAQAMRNSMSRPNRQEKQISKSSVKIKHFHKQIQMRYLRSCFTCHSM